MRRIDWTGAATVLVGAAFVLILMASGCPSSYGADPDFAAFAGEQFVAFGPVPCDAAANRPRDTPVTRSDTKPGVSHGAAPPATPVVAPQPQLWRMWDAAGNSWYEMRPAPAPPPHALPAAGVPAPAPFAVTVAGTTPTTSATVAGPASTSYPAGTPTGLIRIGAPGAATFGSTNCASPFG